MAINTHVVDLASYRAVKTEVASYIDRYLHNPSYRGQVTMMQLVESAMRVFGLKKLDLGKYAVRRVDGGIQIIAKRISDRKCPRCGRPSREASYLRTQVRQVFGTKDLLALGCRCGEVYASWEPNEWSDGDDDDTA